MARFFNHPFLVFGGVLLVMLIVALPLEAPHPQHPLVPTVASQSTAPKVLAPTATFVPTTRPRPPQPSGAIQDQRFNDYCLFASDAYLAGVDMWPVVVEYQRQRLPEWPGTHIPHNDDVLDLLTAMYGVGWHIHQEHDWDAAIAGVDAGHPTVFTGQGHALVIQKIDGERVTYLDSLHPNQTLTMTVGELRTWWDGWAWYREDREP